MRRLRQALILALGVMVGAGMVWLGLWQLDVYQAQGESAAARRAGAPPIELQEVAQAGTRVREGYGRSVRFAGTYLAQPQELVPVAEQPGMLRVVTPLRQADGSVVPVVRGAVLDTPGGPDVPPPPTETVAQTGILLPSEEASGPAGNSLELPVLAQSWPGPLIDGFVVLSAADAQAQSLEPAPVSLPEARGRLRNGAYALQWWVFAAFTVFMAIRIARDSGRGVKARSRAAAT